MQSLTIFGGVDSRYTSVRRLGISRLSKALISKNDFIENMKYLQHTCYNFVSALCLWYKTFKVLRRANPKTLQQHIQLGFLTHTDKTDLLAQFMLDHDKLCNYCMYICIRHERDSRQSPSRSGEVSIISRQRFAGFREKVPFK